MTALVLALPRRHFLASLDQKRGVSGFARSFQQHEAALKAFPQAELFFA